MKNTIFKLSILCFFLQHLNPKSHNAKTLARFMSGKICKEMCSYVMTADEIEREIERKNSETMNTDEKKAEKEA